MNKIEAKGGKDLILPSIAFDGVLEMLGLKGWNVTALKANPLFFIFQDLNLLLVDIHCFLYHTFISYKIVL